MASADDFASQLQALFRVEAREHVEALSTWFVELEDASEPDRRAELMECMMREAHTLKGAAAAAGAEAITLACHSMEDTLRPWRAGEDTPGQDEIDALGAALSDIAADVGAADDTARRAKDTEPAAGQPVPGADGFAPPVTAAPSANTSSGRAQGGAAEPESARGQTVRVSTDRVDTLMLRAEELLAAKLALDRHAGAARDLAADVRAMIRQLGAATGRTSGGGQPTWAELRRLRAALESTQSLARGLSARVEELSRHTDEDRCAVSPLIDDLITQVERVLMLPFASIAGMFSKVVRDLTRQHGLDARLVMNGTETEMDRRVLEIIKDPILHILRNAVGHGIEPPAERERNGKDPRGTVRIDVNRLEGTKVAITISDDGRGVDVEGLRTRAVDSGVATRGLIDSYDEAASLRLAFTSGLSTSAVVTDVLGRGVGLAVVKEKVEDFGGDITLETSAGVGTTVRIVVPATLATIRGAMVEVAGHTFAVPTGLLHRVMRVRRDSLRSAAGQPSTVVDGRAVPVVDLAGLLGLPRPPGAGSPDHMYLFTLVAGDDCVAFGIERVLGEREVLVRPLGPQLKRLPHVCGATVLEDGHVAPVLDTRGLLTSAGALWRAGDVIVAPAEEEVVLPSVLVVEDSATTRMLLRNIFSAAGFQVGTSINGVEARTVLEAQRFDLVVTDIEMPEMDGFELTAWIRGHPDLKRLPVILVTSLEAPADRQRGVEVGANAYVVKSGFDQSNLVTIARDLV